MKGSDAYCVSLCILLFPFLCQVHGTFGSSAAASLFFCLSQIAQVPLNYLSISPYLFHIAEDRLFISEVESARIRFFR